MSKTVLRLLGVLIMALFVLSACNIPSASSPDTGPNLIGTAAAQTVVAQLTQASQGSVTTPTSIFQQVTPLPTQPQATQAAVATATQQPAAATATQQPSATATRPAPTTVQTPCDRAEFVSDVTYPDGQDVSVGAAFVKTWRLKNTGTCTWNSSYALVFYDKNAMGGPASQQLTTGTVAPGQTLDVSVSLQAPGTGGNYEGDWMLRNGSSKIFGIGANADSYFWVKIHAIQGNRISMKTGRTAAVVSGHVDKNGRTTYIVGASASQYMMARADSASANLWLEIKAPDGTTLSKASDQHNPWQGTLPKDGDYTVTVVNTGDAADFNLSVTIPVRVSFKSGATSASLDGFVGGKETNTYLLKALKNQTMTVTIDSDNDDVFLTIYGLTDGNPYVRYVTGKTTFTFDLPSTQDYVIECVNTGSSGENYTIDFVVK